MGAWVVVRAQTPAAGTGALNGTVIDADTGAPIAAAAVAYSSDGNRAQRTTVQSDEAGRFAFTGVPAGRLLIRAQKSGYAGGYYGIRRVSATEQYFELSPGEKASGLVLRMWGHSSIAGRVLDEDGKPVAGAPVAAHMLAVVAGRFQLQPAQSTLTGADGQFRIGSLMPTSYVISAARSASGQVRFFHPSTRHAHEATILELKSSEARLDVVVKLSSVTAVAVSGKVEPLESFPDGLRVDLVAERVPVGVTSNLSVLSAAIARDGTFSFPAVPAGRYIARTQKFPKGGGQDGLQSASQTPQASGFSIAFATRPGEKPLPLAPVPDEPTLYAEVPLAVGSDPIDGLRLVLQPTGRIRGRVVFDGHDEPPTADELVSTPVLVATPSGGVLPSFGVSRLEANLTFRTVGLPPGTYSLFVMPPITGGGISQKSWMTRWKNTRTVQDVQSLGAGLIQVGFADAHVTITFSTESLGGIQGTVLDASGRPVPEASVFVAHADPRLWTAGAVAREVRPGRRGNYEASLVAGDYLVIASATAPEFWAEADALEALMRGATRVTLREGEKKSLDLRVPAGRRP